MEQERRRSLHSIIDLVSFGVMLIVIGYIWTQTPHLPSRVIAFFRSIGTYKNLPPYQAFTDVYDAFVILAFMLGAWSFLIAVIKVPLGLGVSSAVSSVLGGVFLFALGYLVREHYAGSLSTMTIVAILLIIGGLFAIVNGIIYEAGRHRDRA